MFVASTWTKAQHVSFVLAHVPLLHQMAIALLLPLGHEQHVGWQSSSLLHGAPGPPVPHFTPGRSQVPEALMVAPRFEAMFASMPPPAHVIGVVDGEPLLHAVQTTRSVAT